MACAEQLKTAFLTSTVEPASRNFVRIVSPPFRNCLRYPDFEVLYFIGFERIKEGRIVGKVGLGYDYDIVVHELRLIPPIAALHPANP
jgi:hypothetical protein